MLFRCPKQRATINLPVHYKHDVETLRKICCCCRKLASAKEGIESSRRRIEIFQLGGRLRVLRHRVRRARPRAPPTSPPTSRCLPRTTRPRPRSPRRRTAPSGPSPTTWTTTRTGCVCHNDLSFNTPRYAPHIYAHLVRFKGSLLGATNWSMSKIF